MLISISLLHRHRARYVSVSFLLNYFCISFFELSFSFQTRSISTNMAKSSITAAKDFFDPETILGDLCAKASIQKCTEARDVLRRYKHGSTYNDNKTAMKSNFNMGPLEETAKFLKIKTNDDKSSKLRKDDLIHEIICQIQNLLPDTCQICNQRYKTGIEDAAFLACDICGQEVHKPCFMRQLGIEKGSKPNINPLNLPGVHYFCKECERNISSTFNIRFTDNPG